MKLFIRIVSERSDNVADTGVNEDLESSSDSSGRYEADDMRNKRF